MGREANAAIVALTVVLVALTACGSVWDYEIASALYLGYQPSENMFGVLFAMVGPVPTFVGWSFLGASILGLLQGYEGSSKSRRWLKVLAIFLLVVSTAYFCASLVLVNQNAFTPPVFIVVPLGLLLVSLAAFLGYRLSRKSENPDLLKVVVFLAAISLMTLVIVMSTKGIMDRPRFRFVVDTAHVDYFRNWWQSGSDLRAVLASGAITDEFASFPSGHSAYSLFAVFLLPALAAYIPSLEKHRKVLFAAGLVWWMLTAVSRMTMGAHYLTDVSVAGLMLIAAYAVVALARRAIRRRAASADARPIDCAEEGRFEETTGV